MGDFDAAEVIDKACDEQDIPVNQRDFHRLCNAFPEYKEGFDTGYHGRNPPKDISQLYRAGFIEGQHQWRAEVNFWDDIDSYGT